MSSDVYILHCTVATAGVFPLKGGVMEVGHIPADAVGEQHACRATSALSCTISYVILSYTPPHVTRVEWAQRDEVAPVSK